MWSQNGLFMAIKFLDIVADRVQFSQKFETEVSDPKKRMHCMYLGMPDLLLLVLSRELIVFDLQLGARLSSMILPNSSLPDLSHALGSYGYLSIGKQLHEGGIDFIYCSHIDGSISRWRRHCDSMKYSMIDHVDLSPESVFDGVQKIEPSSMSSVVFNKEQLFGVVGKMEKPSSACINHPIFNFKMDEETVHDLDSSGSDNYVEFSAFTLCSGGALWRWRMSHEVDTLQEAVVNFKSSSENNTSISIVSGYNGLSGKITSIATFPRLIKSNPKNYKVGERIPGEITPCEAAVVAGNSEGCIQLLRFCRGRLMPWDISISSSLNSHSSPISGINWLGLSTRVISFSRKQEMVPNSKKVLYLNTVLITDILSGESIHVRENPPEAGALVQICPSPSGKLAILVFQGSPAELWLLSEKYTAMKIRQIDLDFRAIAWMRPEELASETLKPWELFPCSSTSDPNVTFPGTAEPIDETQFIEEKPNTIPKEPEEEYFAFSLHNGRNGVLGVSGRKIRDTRPTDPSWAALSSGGEVLNENVSHRVLLFYSFLVLALVSVFFSLSLLLYDSCTEFIVSAAAAFGNSLVIFGGNDGTLAVWNIQTGETIATNLNCGRIIKIYVYPFLYELGDFTTSSARNELQNLEPELILSEEHEIARLSILTRNGEALIFDLTRSGRLRSTSFSRNVVHARLGVSISSSILPQPPGLGQGTTVLLCCENGSLATMHVLKQGTPELESMYKSIFCKSPSSTVCMKNGEGLQICPMPPICTLSLLPIEVRRLLRILMQHGIPKDILAFLISSEGLERTEKLLTTNTVEDHEMFLRNFFLEQIGIDFDFESNIHPEDTLESPHRHDSSESPCASMKAVLMTPMGAIDSPVSSPTFMSETYNKAQNAAAQLGIKQQQSGSTNSALKKLGGAFKDMALDATLPKDLSPVKSSNFVPISYGFDISCSNEISDYAFQERKEGSAYATGKVSSSQKEKRRGLPFDFAASLISVLKKCAQARGFESLLKDEELATYEASLEDEFGGMATRMMAASILLGSSADEIKFWALLPQTLFRIANTGDNSFKTPKKISISDAEHTGLSSILWTPALELKATAERSIWYSRISVDGLDELTRRSILERRTTVHVALGELHTAVGLVLSSPPVQSLAFYRDAVCALAMSFACGFKCSVQTNVNEQQNANDNYENCSNLEENVGLHKSEINPMEVSFPHAINPDAVGSTHVDEAAHSLFAQSCKVIAANAASFGDTTVSLPLLCSTGNYVEAVSSLQSDGLWSIAAALMSKSMKKQERCAQMLIWAKYMAESQCRIWEAASILIANEQIEEAIELLLRQGFADAAITIMDTVECFSLKIKNTELKTKVQSHFLQGVQNILGHYHSN